MKKFLCLSIIPLFVALCGCENTQRSETRFIMDTVVTLTADCSDGILNGAFELCESYDRMLSRTNKESDVYKLNSSDGFTDINEETLKIVERSIYYSNLTDGKFDITICPVSELWDFKNQIIPPKDEIAQALKNVDYEAIEIKETEINLNGKKIDLGGIAKGFVADKIKTFFNEMGVSSGIINLGGNVVVFGKEYCVGIQKPFTDEVCEYLYLTDKSVVTSGIYQRYIEKDGEIYHHILNPDTGFAQNNSLASVTVIGDSSLDCDALSTVCMLEGKTRGMEIIENTAATEAVFIERDGTVTLSSGLKEKGNGIYLK